MVTFTRTAIVNEGYRAMEELVRAGCTSASEDQGNPIRAVTISHRTDQMSSGEVSSIIDLARGLANDVGLEVEVNSSSHHLALRVSKPAPEHAGNSDQSATETGALWRWLIRLARK